MSIYSKDLTECAAQVVEQSDMHASDKKIIASRLRGLQSVYAQCRAAGFIDDEGKVRKVLGTLLLTADGCVLGDWARPFVLHQNGSIELGTTRTTTASWTNTATGRKANLRYGSLACYSTRESALAAKEPARE